MARRPSVSPEHVIWAWDEHIFDMAAEGMTVAQIRKTLREESSLHVGETAIRAVLGTMPKDWTPRFGGGDA